MLIPPLVGAAQTVPLHDSGVAVLAVAEHIEALAAVDVLEQVVVIVGMAVFRLPQEPPLLIGATETGVLVDARPVVGAVVTDLKAFSAVDVPHGGGVCIKPRHRPQLVALLGTGVLGS